MRGEFGNKGLGFRDGEAGFGEEGLEIMVGGLVGFRVEGLRFDPPGTLDALKPLLFSEQLTLFGWSSWFSIVGTTITFLAGFSI